MEAITIKYADAKGDGQAMQVPDGERAAVYMQDGATIQVFRGEFGIQVEVKAARPPHIEDVGRIDFMERHKLYASPNDLGEWQVWESVPHHYSDGCVTRNSFLSSMREAIDYAIEFYIGGENQLCIENEQHGTD